MKDINVKLYSLWEDVLDGYYINMYGMMMDSAVNIISDSIMLASLMH